MTVIRILVTLFCLFICAAACALDYTTMKNLEGILAAMPEPTPEELLHLYNNQKEMGDKDKVTLMILKLRESDNPAAVPVLKEILDKDLTSGRNYTYIIPQALYCIGTPEALSILDDMTLNNKYSSSSGISEAIRWKMKEPARSGFIERCFLKNTSDSLAITLDADHEGKGKDKRYVFRITLKNISGEPYQICDNRLYMGMMLHIKDLSDNAFSPKAIALTYDAEMPDWIELKPGAEHQFTIKGAVEKMKDWQRAILKAPKSSEYILNTFDMMFDIKNKGDYAVYAVFENYRMSPGQLKRLGIDNPWYGRAASEPVKINLE